MDNKKLPPVEEIISRVIGNPKSSHDTAVCAGINECYRIIKDACTTSCSKPTEPFDAKELMAMLEKAGKPQGIVLLPNGPGFDVYQFPAAILKGAISFMMGSQPR